MMFAWALSLLCFGLSIGNALRRIPALNSYDPGSCNETIHGKEVLVTDKTDEEVILICVRNKGVYQWRPLDGSKKTVGEFFNPGLNCSDILDKHEDAKNGFYWITLPTNRSDPVKVFCDMSTDGGGFMLIGRKNNSVTWTVPSNYKKVEPYGEPHWSSSLGDAPILDFRVQMAIKDDFKATKAHWSFRLQSKRPLKKLMMISAGCDQRSAGIGDIAYVKDLLTEKIVTTKLRCSKFGLAHHRLARFGWHKMNSCLQKPCQWGFAFHDIIQFQLDYYGGFSFSTTGNMSGMEHTATAFVGCDNGYCCGCYGPVGGAKDYCAENCKAINGGTVTKNVFTWFWVRSSLPRRLWKKCVDYQVKRDDGKLISHKLIGHSVIPVEGSCGKDSTLLHDGIVVVPDSSAAQKVPAVDGLLEYRKDKQELYIRSNKTWNVLAPENKIVQETDRKHKSILNKIGKLEQNLGHEKSIMQESDKNNKLNSDQIRKLEKNLTKIVQDTDRKYKSILEKIEKLEKNFNDEKTSIMQESDKKDKLNSDEIRKLEKNLTNIMQKSNKQEKLNSDEITKLEKNVTNLINLVKKVLLPQHQECFEYKVLSESSRNRKYSGFTGGCDKSLSGWYRFKGSAGTKIPTSCVPSFKCGTFGSGWMNGAHPTVGLGKVTRKVCYNLFGDCCYFSNNIEVVNCRQYYVYKLGSSSCCNCKYCGSDN